MPGFNEQFHGIIVPMVTPLTPEGRVDHDSLRNLTGYLVDAGVNGIFVMGTTGEFAHIDDEDQWAAVETVADEVNGRLLVVAGVTGRSIETSVRNMVVLGSLSTRPDALVIAPLCYHSNRKLPRHMARICHISNLPLILYNNIGIVTRRWKRKDIIPDVLARIVKQERVVGIKDSSGNLNYLEQMLSYRSDAFRVFQGDEGKMLAALQLGAVGAVPSIGNIVPGVCMDLYHSIRNSDVEKANYYQEFIKETHDLYLPYGNIPRILKEYLVSKGIIESAYCHIPFSEDAAAISDRVAVNIQELGLNMR